MDSVEWVQLSDDTTSKAYFWHRRTHQTAWPPAGIEVVWVGSLDKEGVLYCWHKGTRVSRFDFPPLTPGLSSAV